MTLREDWSASTYLRFEDERTRPAVDLLARVAIERPRKIFDIGCGPGNSTELLARRFPEAEVAGVDTSPDMLAAARERLHGARFVEADVATWKPEAPADLIFANAVLQWLPAHETLLPRLVKSLALGGVLAVQMPDNRSEPSHVAMAEVARDPAWAARIANAGGARTDILSAEGYYDLLMPHCSVVEVWRTTYVHPLDGAEAIAGWCRSTGLRPYLDPLDEAERERFLVLYVERLRAYYPERAGGKALLRFPRIFVVATRK
jgi:trans-aconitate 2-methyltransferase